jgi:endonuclease YncB( thermonuclease family)
MSRFHFFRLTRLAPVLLACATASLMAARAVDARDEISGPVSATVVRVIDGDTFVAEAHVWPGETVRVSVRIRGIDAPELHSRCQRERLAAAAARDALAALLDRPPVKITNIGGGKYYGRMLADVETEDGEVAPALLSRALVRLYSGGRRQSYCG